MCLRARDGVIVTARNRRQCLSNSTCITYTYDYNTDLTSTQSLQWNSPVYNNFYPGDVHLNNHKYIQRNDPQIPT